jgi:hypothetical protein
VTAREEVCAGLSKTLDNATSRYSRDPRVVDAFLVAHLFVVSSSVLFQPRPLPVSAPWFSVEIGFGSRMTVKTAFFASTPSSVT